MKNLAVLSFIYENTPGETVAEINNWNLLNLPTPGVGRPYSFVDKPLNVLKLMSRDHFVSNTPFSYFKYMGSMTSPPCAENVVWFVVDTAIPQGSTALNMIRDALNPPGKTPHDKEPNYDGSNREV